MPEGRNKGSESVTGEGIRWGIGGGIVPGWSVNRPRLG